MTLGEQLRKAAELRKERNNKVFFDTLPSRLLSTAESCAGHNSVDYDSDMLNNWDVDICQLRDWCVDNHVLYEMNGNKSTITIWFK